MNALLEAPAAELAERVHPVAEILRPIIGSRVERARVALPLPEGLTFDAWATIGEGLCRVERSIQWLIADWWIYGERRYGERAKLIQRLRDEGRDIPDFQTCANLGSVARAIEASRRREVLSFTHHAEVAGLDPAEQDEILDRAEREKLTTRAVRAEVARIRNARAIGAELPDFGTCSVADLHKLADAGAKFGCVYADPPWLYDNQGTRAATGTHYGGMTVEELAALPVRRLAADDAHLHLWVTNAFLEAGLALCDAWGFTFKSSFVWVKPRIGLGNYWRNRHEIMLTAVRGDATRFADRSLPSTIECDRGAHSEKPEAVRGLIERASPGPYLELFGRRLVDGWAVWGDQVPASALCPDVRDEAA